MAATQGLWKYDRDPWPVMEYSTFMTNGTRAILSKIAVHSRVSESEILEQLLLSAAHDYATDNELERLACDIEDQMGVVHQIQEDAARALLDQLYPL